MHPNSEAKTDSIGKNFSTSQSQNSTSNIREDHQNPLEGYRLFTFMNYKDSPENHKSNQISNETLKLKQIIEHSRNRRQRYLKQIELTCLNAPPQPTCDPPKTTRTSLHLNSKSKLPKKQKSTLKLLDGIKSPRKNSVSPTVCHSQRMFRAKSCKGAIASFKKPIIEKPFQSILQKADKKQVQRLIKKKQQLEKQLLDINSSLLIKKKKSKLVSKPFKKKSIF